MNIDEKTLLSIFDKANKYDNLAKFQSTLVLHCTFCGKSQNEVSKLIAGPGVYICNECVDLCVKIIEEEKKEQLKSEE